ncbi:tyrosine-type recombinase/integrase [Microbacterium amylolyticum]|uniref:Integrase n=1 Tax=Microbacterium amylolyticum TaxID=936337 RepID=A0ABS4ZF56_9MICO|nr:tyrosine-type recombinase/integrase [Microbacterium amylolyticum]MBP2435904.1 integrase [Microbacterium amylolyticum]
MAYFRDWDGVTRPIQRVGKTGAEAERRLIKAMKERATPSSDVLSRDSTFTALATAWLITVDESDRADSTKARYRDLTERVLTPPLKEVRLRELSVPLLDRVLQKARSKVGPSTVKTARTVLVQMCAYALRKGALDSNLGEGTETVQIKKKAETALTVDDVKAIRALLVARDESPDKQGRRRYTRISDVADFYAGTGARTNEVLALGWDWVDLDAKTAFLERTLVEINGKVKIQDKPKSDDSRRKVALPQYVVDMLMRRRIQATTGLVFPSSRGTPQQDGNLMRMWSAALAKTPYEDVTPTTFRKAVATLLAAEVGAEAAASQLGHHDVSVTKKHYIRRENLGPSEAREVLGALFAP